MGSLDRLLELCGIDEALFPHLNKLTRDEEQEYQSLKSQIEKAIEDSKKYNDVRALVISDYTIKLIYKEKEIQQLKKDFDYAQQVIRETQQHFHEECDSHELTKQQCKKNQEIVDRLKEEIKLLSRLRFDDEHLTKEPYCESCLRYDYFIKILDGGEK